MAALAQIDFQTLTARKFNTSPSNWEDQVLYFLLVDRFSDNQEKDYSPEGKTLPYNPFDNDNAVSNDAEAGIWRDAGGKWCGGNLKGITNKINYLKELGITTIWISPVFRQVTFEESYHGYGIQNFLETEPHFGTADDLKELADTAHLAGIYVILDIILNHTGNVFSYDGDLTSSENPVWSGQKYPVKGFNDSRGNPSIPFAPDSNLRSEDAVWPVEFQNPDTFTCKGKIRGWDNFPEFLEGDFESLKDITLGQGPVDNYTASSALIHLVLTYKYWIAFADIDGYRVDTVKHMDPGAVRYFVSCIHEFAQSIGKDNFYLIGEITGGRENAVNIMETTGLNAALGIDEIQDRMEFSVKGICPPAEYFNLFRNSILVGKESHTWFKDKVVTMFDDHDKVCKGNYKTRFCANHNGKELILNALALNVTTLGIPCIYYGSEQGFDGQGDNDRYIRESMFGGDFGAFRTKERNFFIQNTPAYTKLSQILGMRRSNIALRRGRQYLREISADGLTFAYPDFCGDSKVIQSVISWSRIMDTEEILLAINNDLNNDLSVWVTIDNGLHLTTDYFNCIYSSAGMQATPAKLKVEEKNGKAVFITVPKAGFVIYKK